MRTGAVLVEISEDLAERLDQMAVAEGRSAPELLAPGLQLVVGLGANRRAMLEWMGREGTPEERNAILWGMRRYGLLAYGEVLVARAAACVSREEVDEFISEAEMAIQEYASLGSDATEQENFGEAWEAF